MTAERLRPLATGGWKQIKVKSVGKKRAQLLIGQHLICVATAADAKANKMSALGLAKTWVTKLRNVFSLPAISVNPKVIVVPENETRSAVVGGAATGPVWTLDNQPTVAASSIDPNRRTVVVQGKYVGQCNIDVYCQGCKTSLTVIVKRYAGKVTSTGYAEVTGEPATDHVMLTAARQAASAGIQLEPGATATYGKPQLTSSTLKSGQAVRIMVPVKVSGPKLLPKTLLAPVDVMNRPVSRKSVSNLFYSNNPERITKHGTLFTGKLSYDEQIRLFFHHQNMLGKRVRFAIELINGGSTLASVQSISGISPPKVDTVDVGYVAGMGFIRDYLKHVGMVHRIPPRSKMVLYATNLNQINTTSGIIDLRQFSGEDVYVKVVAYQASSGNLSEGDIFPITESQIPTQLSDHIYTEPKRQLDVKYVVGQQWQFIRIGKNAISSTSNEKRLDGNYGVIYEISAHVENPTADNKTVQVLFEPTAGAAAGVFVINGQLMGVKTMYPPKEAVIAKIRVPSGESRNISIMTIPLGGSAYPATIIIK
jgi:hypothetical protein